MMTPPRPCQPSRLPQLDRHPCELPCPRVQILDLDAFRRHLENTSSEPTNHEMPPPDAHTIDAETQLAHELSLAFTDLGAAAFALAHHAALNDKRLAPRVQRIHQLHAQLDALAHRVPLDTADHNPRAGDLANV